MPVSRPAGLAQLSALFMAAAIAVPAHAQAATKPFACAPIPEPVISLSYGSRYATDSKSHSDIDPDSNAAVNAALKPVEAFINYLSRVSNDALFSETDRSKRVACVANSLTAWANGRALTQLNSVDANLSVGSAACGACDHLHASRQGWLDRPGAAWKAILAWVCRPGHRDSNFLRQQMAR